MAPDIGTLVAVSVGRRRQFEYNGRPAESAIWKSPVTGRVAVRGVNLKGDEQADRSAHGGPDKAVYSYAFEDKRWWESQIGRKLEHGEFGENLTTEGIDVTGAVVGDGLHVGVVHVPLGVGGTVGGLRVHGRRVAADAASTPRN